MCDRRNATDDRSYGRQKRCTWVTAYKSLCEGESGCSVTPLTRISICQALSAAGQFPHAPEDKVLFACQLSSPTIGRRMAGICERPVCGGARTLATAARQTLPGRVLPTTTLRDSDVRCCSYETVTVKVYSTPANTRGGRHIPAADGRHRINLNGYGRLRGAVVGQERSFPLNASRHSDVWFTAANRHSPPNVHGLSLSNVKRGTHASVRRRRSTRGEVKLSGGRKVAGGSAKESTSAVATKPAMPHIRSFRA